MAKRFNREGTYRQRPDGRWEGRLAYTDDDGNRKRLSFYGASQEEARSKLEEAARRLRQGDPAKDSRMTVAAWCDQWCATTLEASDRKPTTKALMRTMLNTHVKTCRIADMPLAKLRASHLEAWVLELRKRTKTATVGGEQVTVPALSPATVQRAFRVLSVVLDGAVRDEHLAVNPARKVPQPKAERGEAHVLSVDEVRRILESAREMDEDARGRRSHNFPLFALIAATGMRKGEALALRWSDIDLDGGVIHVRGTLSRVGNRLVVTTPKTRAGKRTLHISDGLVAVLRAHRLAQLEDRMRAANVWEDTGHVFTTGLGTPRDPRGVLRSMEAAARRAGVSGVNVHTLRHSAATAMLDSGVHVKAVSVILGHAGTQVTTDIYAHLTDQTARKALNGLGAAIGLN